MPQRKSTKSRKRAPVLKKATRDNTSREIARLKKQLGIAQRKIAALQKTKTARTKKTLTKPLAKQSPIKRVKTARVKLPQFHTPKRAPLVKINRKIVLPKTADIIAKLRTLEKYGIFKPRKKLTRKNITRKQVNEISKRFDDIQKHGTMVRGRVQRPFKRTMKGWTLTDRFKFAIGKPVRSSPGIVKTRTGAIVETEAAKAKVKDDGTIVTREKRFGKMRTVYSGSLSRKQTLLFLTQVENGTFKWPKGMALYLTMFGNRIKSTELVTLRGLRNYLIGGYLKKIQDHYARHPHEDVSPLTLEFYKSDES